MMSATDAPKTPFMAPDKMPSMDRNAKFLAWWHSLYLRQIQEIEDATLSLTDFLTKDLSEEMKNIKLERTMSYEEIQKKVLEESNKKDHIHHPIIHPYAFENQHMFEEHMKSITRASHSIYPIITEIFTKIMAATRPTEQQQRPQGSIEITNNNQPPQKKPWFSFGAKEEKKIQSITDLSANALMYDPITELMQLPTIIRQYKGFHWKRVTQSYDIMYDNREGQIYALFLELEHFHSNVEPRIMAFDEALRLKLEQENIHIERVLAKGQDAFERREMASFGMPPQPQ